MEKGDTVINVGPVDVTLSYRREIMPDQGLMVQVYGDVDGQDTEILRFDCFDQAPHYHYGQVYGDVDGQDTEILRFDCFDRRT